MTNCCHHCLGKQMYGTPFCKPELQEKKSSKKPSNQFISSCVLLVSQLTCSEVITPNFALALSGLAACRRVRTISASKFRNRGPEGDKILRNVRGGANGGDLSPQGRPPSQARGRAAGAAPLRGSGLCLLSPPPRSTPAAPAPLPLAAAAPAAACARPTAGGAGGGQR